MREHRTTPLRADTLLDTPLDEDARLQRRKP
jgi:hypothetical protein